MELWAKVFAGTVFQALTWTAGRSRAALPPAGTPVPWNGATRAAGVTPMTVRWSRSAHGDTAEAPRPRRSAGAKVWMLVFIRCPLLSDVVPTWAAGIAGVQLVCAWTL